MTNNKHNSYRSFSNLLLPEGMTLERQRAIFVFKIYKAEDIAKSKATALTILKNPQLRHKDMPNTAIEITFAGVTVCEI